MKINVKLFAAARETAGLDQVELMLDHNADVAALREQLVVQLPDLAHLAPSLLVAVNSEYAADDRSLRDSDDIACFPPVSGG